MTEPTTPGEGEAASGGQGSSSDGDSSGQTRVPERADPGDVVPRTDRGLTRAGDVGHRDYVLDKLRDAATTIDAVRDPQSWQRQVEQFGDQKTLHDTLMHGYQALNGRTAEDGWRTEYARPTPLGLRRHDVALVVEGFGAEDVLKTTEYKAGSVNRDDGLKQLRKEDHLIKTGQTQQISEYVIRAERPPHPDVMREAHRLAEKYPGQFVVVELSEREFNDAVEVGRPIVRALAAKKLEKAIELVREVPELNIAFPALRSFIHEIEKAQERGKPIGLEVLVGARGDLASLIEVDREATQRMDQAAREAAKLRLKDSLVVEHVQAQKLGERYQEMNLLLERVDTAVVHTAARVVEGHVPTRDRELLREQVRAIQERDIEQGPKRDLLARMTETVRVANELGRDRDQERVQEREALDRLGLHPHYRDAAAKELEIRRDERDRGLTAHLMQASDPANSRPSPQQIEQARAEERVRAERARVREQEKAKLLARLVDAHNARLAEVALEQAKTVGREDRTPGQRAVREVEHAHQSLTLDREALARQVDPRAIDGLLRGEATWNQEVRAYTLEVGGETLHFGRSSYEVHYAEQIRRVELGQDLRGIQVNKLRQKPGLERDLGHSREELDRVREDRALAVERARERDPDFRTKVVKREQERGRERGIERGR
ncbi:hypothetical protein ACFWVM_29120 [Nocardia fluminea]|uniref:hypothetical protein n=1 Tax=Nocardia fluminea TaxID=134984 RepID=UPI003649592C